jgi:flagellar basal-body rod protein FlgB
MCHVSLVCADEESARVIEHSDSLKGRKLKMGSPILAQLESYLSLTNKRETVIASNVANVDTPGYRTKDIDFQHELTRAMQTPEELTRRIPVQNVNGLLERPDGNNVDIDRESLKLSQVQLQYQAGTQLIKDRFHELLTAINGDQ